MIQPIILNMVVRNEEKRIGVMLAMTLPLVDGAVIIDQASEDDTVRICRAFGVTVIPDYHHGYCEPSRALAAANSPDGSWLLIMDADELLLPQFAREMRDLDRWGYVGAVLRFSYWLDGEHQGDGDPHYRFTRKDKVILDPGLHRPPRPVGAEPNEIYRPDYPAIMHIKNWTEQLSGEENYEQVLLRETVSNHADVLRLSTRNLNKAREQKFSGHDLDQMSIAERHRYQFGLWE